MKPIIFFPLSVMLILLICPGVSHGAPSQVGSVVAVRGEATATGTDGAQRALDIESAVFREDTLKTGDSGRVQVLFNDATLISIGPGSEMIVAQYEWDGSSGKMENRVKEGFFHIMGGNIAKQSPENFNTKTPIATIGIRGSTYALRLFEDELSVVFIGGTGIHVTNDMGRLEITRPGYGTTLRQKELKAPALKKFSEKELEGVMAPEKPGANTPPGKQKRPAPEGRLREEAFPRREKQENIEAVNKEVDRNQQIIQSRVQIPDFTGAYMSLLRNPDEAAPVITAATTGSLAGVSREGRIAARGESITGDRFSFDFDIPPVNPGGRYTGVTQAFERINPFPIAGFFPESPLSAKLFYSPLGEFAILDVSMDPVLSLQKTYHYGMLGFIGIPASEQRRPTDIIYSYAGPATGFSHLFSDAFMEGGSGRMKMKVNWHDNRFIGLIENEFEDKTLIPFFGTLKENEPVMEHVVFLGNFYAPRENPAESEAMDSLPGNGRTEVAPISWITGSDIGFGRFYGSAYQGFGGLAHGGIVEIQTDQTRPVGQWDIAAGAFRLPEIQLPSYGKLVLSGFVSGIGDNMTAPHIEPRFYQNHVSSDFRITIDRDAGTLDGTLSARDFTNDARALSNIEIGGRWESAYIDDAYFIALMGSDNGVTSTGHTGGLKPYGNYLQPGNQDEQLAEHTSWGYWEAAYDDPASGEPIHVHVPGSLWIAGEVTPADTVSALIETRHTGRYEGSAKGVLSSPGPQHMVTLDGQVEMNIDFAPSSPAPVTGRIRFADPGINLVMERGTVTPSGFTGTFKDTLRSDLNGAFFGPNADSVAGNFAAFIEQEKAVTGIFGANRIRP